jgi:hypothetical protein
MSLKNTPLRWGAVAQLLHWVVVWAILTQFLLADAAEDLPAGVGKLATLARHKSVGITILLLAVLRLAWKQYNRGHSPPLPANLKPYEVWLARLTHHGLYGLLLLLPLSGWLMSSAKNYPVSWFGIAALPDLVAPSETLFILLKAVHEILADLLVVLALLHVGAALVHHFVRRDDVVRRMLPFPGKAGARIGVMLVFVVLGALALSRLLPGAGTPSEDTAPGTQTATTAADAGANAASAWVTDANRSTLEFVFTQSGAATTGHFSAFSADVDFTPGTTPAGRLAVRIEMNSADTGDAGRNEQLGSVDLFNVAGHPQATYDATAFTAQADGSYRADGALTLRGVSVPVPLQLRFTPEGDEAVLEGTATLDRLAFGVGQGEWKSTEWIAAEVKVAFNVRLVKRR